jgi:hypothetical protein
VIIDQIAKDATSRGTVYVSLTAKDKLESKTRTAVFFTSETSPAPLATTITVTNAVTGGSDTVKVTGLAEGDIVSVYAVASGGTALGTATVASGDTQATVSGVDMLNAAGGTCYVTVTKVNKWESARTAKLYVKQ